jgi:hypothetical protein
VNAKYWGSQILPGAYPAQRGMGAGFHFLTGQSIATLQRSAIFGESPSSMSGKHDNKNSKLNFELLSGKTSRKYANNNFSRFSIYI